MLTKRICLTAVVLATLACAAKSSSSTPQQPAPASSTSSSDVITEQALADPSVNTGDAYEAVRRLRPRFLSNRGSGSIQSPGAGAVHVSIDGGPLTTVDQLKRMRANDVSEIRYLNSSEASLRFGINAGTGGVILVKSKR